MFTSGDHGKLSSQLLKTSTTRSLVLAVLVIVMILSVITTLWLIVNPNAPSFHFMKTEQFEVFAVIFGGTPSNANNYINMTILNTGISSFTIDTAARVNGINKPLARQLIIEEDCSAIVTIPNVNWNTGQQYNMELLTIQGTKITYVTDATPGGQSPNPHPTPGPVDLPPLLRAISPWAIIILEAILITTNYSPLIVAAQIVIVEIAIVAIAVRNKAHSQGNVPTITDQLPEPPPIFTTKGLAHAAVGVLMILGLIIAYWLVYSYLCPPLVFALIFGL